MPSRSAHAELRAGLEAASADPQCRVVLLTGAGRAFSAGQDLAEIGGPTEASSPDAGSRLEQAYNPLIKLITTLEKPVICAVNGIAAGAGANVALACDLVYAARSASFLQAFARIGLIPDAGGTWALPRLVGAARARPCHAGRVHQGRDGGSLGPDLEVRRRRQAGGRGRSRCRQAGGGADLRAGARQACARRLLDQHARPAARPRARSAEACRRLPRRTRGHRRVSREAAPKYTGRKA